MASLENLPAPLPLQIVRNLADLKSLDSLQRCSPVFNIVFRQHAVEVIEHIMRETLLSDVLVEVRAYLLLLPRHCKMQTESDFHALYAQANQPLDPGTPVTAISHTLREFSFLASAADMTLRVKLDNLYALPHEHLQAGHYSHEEDLVRDEPSGVAYSVPEPSPPDWVEQQRFLRAVWRTRVAEKSRGVANAFALRQLPHRRDPASLMLQRPKWDADEIEEATSSLEELQAAGVITADHSVPLSWHALADVPLPLAKATPSAVAWRETLDSAYSAQHHSGGFLYFFLPSTRRPQRPLSGADWTILRRLGLGIWRNSRLGEELELRNYPIGIKPPAEGFVYRVGIDDFISPADMQFTWGKLYEAALAARIA